MEALVIGLLFVLIVNVVWLVIGVMGVVDMTLIGALLLALVVVVHSFMFYLVVKAVKETYGE